MNEEYDIVEMDFPDYEEPYPPFPDVKVALFDKDSSYSRNRDIADRLYADRQKEEDRLREERRRAELEKMERLNPAALRPKSKAAKIIPAAAAVLAITAMVATSLTSGGMIQPPDDAVSSDKAVSEEVLGPFEKEDETVVYNTAALCYKISLLKKSSDRLSFSIDINNLSKNIYIIQNDNFYISDGTKRIFVRNMKVNYLLAYYDSRNIQVSFETDRGFDCKYIGYYDKYPSEHGIANNPNDFEVSVEELL